MSVANDNRQRALGDDREAQSLALKVVDAVKAESAAMPQFLDKLPSLPPGVTLVFATKDAHLRREVSNTVRETANGGTYSQH